MIPRSFTVTILDHTRAAHRRLKAAREAMDRAEYAYAASQTTSARVARIGALDELRNAIAVTEEWDVT